MYRIRIQMPRGRWCSYRYLDLLHDALIAAWVEAGASSGDVTGQSAKPWNFAALGFHRADGNRVHTLVVATPDEALGENLRRLRPQHVRKSRSATCEEVDFSEANVGPDPAPLAPTQESLPAILLSPLAARLPSTTKGRWCTDLRQVDLTAAASARLSRIANREVRLTVSPDALYLKANPRHSVLVPLKRYADGRHAFAIGMVAPLALSGSDEDLRLAWHAGIGEKTRAGFGCLGLLEKGVGR